MNNTLINSAALYFRPEPLRMVPSLWLSRVIGFFESQMLSVDYFDISAPGVFEVEEVFDFDTCKEQLVRAICDGRMESISIYSNKNVTSARSDWRAMVSVDMDTGALFVGIDDDLISDHALLLRSAHDVVRDMFTITYGLSYKAPLASGPECYQPVENVMN